jgi:hypothetical protein
VFRLRSPVDGRAFDKALDDVSVFRLRSPVDGRAFDKALDDVSVRRNERLVMAWVLFTGMRFDSPPGRIAKCEPWVIEP